MDPLAQLQDIHLPDAVSWWPPAPGWLFVCGVLLVAAGFFATRWFLGYRRNRYRRVAVSELEQLAAALDARKNPTSTLQAVNGLLKRVALRAYSREDVAQLHGADWASFLAERGKLGKRQAETARLLAEAPYQAEPPISGQKELADCIQMARDWIRRHA